jgi:hypothetical protein
VTRIPDSRRTSRQVRKVPIGDIVAYASRCLDQT